MVLKNTRVGSEKGGILQSLDFELMVGSNLHAKPIPILQGVKRDWLRGSIAAKNQEEWYLACK